MTHEALLHGWTLAAALAASLTVGFAIGWATLSRLRLRSPNAWVTMAVLLAGSVGGPAASTALLGHTPSAYLLAVAAAGFTAGATFWPMGRAQGTREWL